MLKTTEQAPYHRKFHFLKVFYIFSLCCSFLFSVCSNLTGIELDFGREKMPPFSEPETIAYLPWGEEGVARPLSSSVPGVSCFFLLNDERIAVVDSGNARIKVLDSKGKLLKNIPFPLSDERYSFITDSAAGPKNTFYLADNSLSRILLFRPESDTLTVYLNTSDEIEGIQKLFSDRAGNLYCLSPPSTDIIMFNPQGGYAGSFSGFDFSPLITGDQRLIVSEQIDERKVRFFKIKPETAFRTSSQKTLLSEDKRSGTPGTFSINMQEPLNCLNREELMIDTFVIESSNILHLIYETAVIGVDREKNLYVTSTEGKNGEPDSTWIYRITSSGKPLAKIRTRPLSGIDVFMARPYRIDSKGRIYTCKSSDSGFYILRYSFDSRENTISPEKVFGGGSYSADDINSPGQIFIKLAWGDSPDCAGTFAKSGAIAGFTCPASFDLDMTGSVVILDTPNFRWLTFNNLGQPVGQKILYSRASTSNPPAYVDISIKNNLIGLADYANGTVDIFDSISQTKLSSITCLKKPLQISLVSTTEVLVYEEDAPVTYFIRGKQRFPLPEGAYPLLLKTGLIPVVLSDESGKKRIIRLTDTVSMKPGEFATYKSSSRLVHFFPLGDDIKGNIYFFAQVRNKRPEAIVISPAGKIENTFPLPPPPSLLVNRYARVSPDGTIYSIRTTENYFILLKNKAARPGKSGN